MRGALATLGAGGWMDLAGAGTEDPCAAAEAAGRELQGISPGRGSSSLPGSGRGSAATTGKTVLWAQAASVLSALPPRAAVAPALVGPRLCSPGAVRERGWCWGRC